MLMTLGLIRYLRADIRKGLDGPVIACLDQLADEVTAFGKKLEARWTPGATDDFAIGADGLLAMLPWSGSARPTCSATWPRSTRRRAPSIRRSRPPRWSRRSPPTSRRRAR
jgi:hypothetical protein